MNKFINFQSGNYFLLKYTSVLFCVWNSNECIIDNFEYKSCIRILYKNAKSSSIVDIPAGKEISDMIILKRWAVLEIKLLKKIIDKSTRKIIRTVSPIPDILYRLGKIRKASHNWQPSFSPSTLQTYLPTPKFAFPFSLSSTISKYTVIDSFHFVEEVFQQDRNICMASLHFDFLFKNIALDEAIDIYIDN